MYARGLKHFFINEVAQLDTGSYVVPLSWIKRQGKICADCRIATISNVRADLFRRNQLTDYIYTARMDGWTSGPERQC